MTQAHSAHTTIRTSAKRATTPLFRQFLQRGRLEGGGWVMRVLARFGASELDQLTDEQIMAALAA